LSLPLNAVRHFLSVGRGEKAVTFILAVFFLTVMVWDDFETGYLAAIKSRQSDSGADIVVLSFTKGGSSAAGDAELVLLVDLDEGPDVCALVAPAAISPLDLPSRDATGGASNHVIQPESVIFGSSGSGGKGLLSLTRRRVQVKFASTYRSILKVAAMMGLPRIQEEAALSGATIIGTVSTYNPYRDGKDEGGVATASGELYDSSAWTAAIQTGLRGQFGGVRYGRLYQPTYALVASGEKQLIVKINDVGPLKSGRVLDLNERSMRYFDPLLTRGLIQDVEITLLPGEDWAPGPVGELHAIDFASAPRRRLARSAGEEDELANMRARFGYGPEPDMKADAQLEVRLSGG
jgi:rare lipoprotein A